MVIAVNKWDLIEDKNAKLADLREECERFLPQLRGVPLVTISGLQGRNIDQADAGDLRHRESVEHHVSTAKLNRWLPA
jgi:GTP-binding protein